MYPSQPRAERCKQSDCCQGEILSASSASSSSQFIAFPTHVPKIIVREWHPQNVGRRFACSFSVENVLVTHILATEQCDMGWFTIQRRNPVSKFLFRHSAAHRMFVCYRRYPIYSWKVIYIFITHLFQGSTTHPPVDQKLYHPLQVHFQAIWTVAGLKRETSAGVGKWHSGESLSGQKILSYPSTDQRPG